MEASIATSFINVILRVLSSIPLTGAPSYNNPLLATYNTRTPTVYIGDSTKVEAYINVLGSNRNDGVPSTDIKKWMDDNSATWIGNSDLLKSVGVSSWACVIDLRWS